MGDILVVGAGQLGLMMAAAGARLGISVDRIDHLSGEILPGTSASRFHLSHEEVRSRYRIVTAELEHLLGNAMVEGLRGEPGWCNARAMTVLPARDQQKALLDQLHVMTAPWQIIRSREDLRQAHQQIGDELVLKSIRDGYDGRGQWRVSTHHEEEIPETAYGEIIAERRIPFDREVSLVGARFRDGSQAFYPLVENYHQAGMLRYTLAPAGADPSLQDTAQTMLGKIMGHLDYVGVMAMECFQTRGDLLVNELAPRVHNSGHWTQVGAGISQFDLHLFALLDRPVRSLSPRPGLTLMLNLIGCQWHPSWQGLAAAQCWWYGKSWRENRKLGHIHIHGTTRTEVIQEAGQLMETLDPFHREMLARAIARIRST